MLILLFAGCGWFRVAPPGGQDDTGVPLLGVIELGEVPLGTTLAVRTSLAPYVQAPATAALTEDGLSVTLTDEAPTVEVRWSPTAQGEATAELLTDDGVLQLHASTTDALSPLPSPLATSMGFEPLDSEPDTLLGSADLSGLDRTPFAADPVSANAWFGDPDSGRAWRLDRFYHHARWGLWVANDREDQEPWIDPPRCFAHTNGLDQDGTCDGTEVDTSGRPPRGWHFFHGGIAGDGELAGLTDLVADPDRGRVWALGPGWLQAIDTDLYTTPDEGTDSYSFTQLISGLVVQLGEDWTRPTGWIHDGELLLLDLDDGQLGVLAAPASGDPPTPLLSPLGAVDRAALDGDDLVFSNASGVHRVDLGTGEQTTLASSEGTPRATWAEAGGVWTAWADRVWMSWDGEERWLAPPEVGGRFISLAFDRLSGGSAEPMDILYVLGSVDGQGRLWGLSPEGAWLGAVELPAIPSALGYARDPHDLYVLYPAGADGCEDEAFAEAACTDGQHPAVVQPLYNPYSLVPPTSDGHLLNLFLSPIIETPKDDSVDTDWSGSCGDAVEPACCALAWSIGQRLQPNIDYLAALQAMGDDTTSLDDDPTLVWGVNPSVLRQARICLDSDDPDSQQAGLDTYLAISALPGPRAEISAWTHTATAVGREDNQNQRWFLDQLYTEDVDYTLPLDTQHEYQLLHNALASMFVADDLDGVGDLWTPLSAGNSLDAEDLVDPDGGWPDDDPSWVIPVRDGPLAVGQPARQGYYFLSTGADVEIGTQTYRKKDLWPIDVRQRAHLAELPEDAVDFGVVEQGSSGLVNLPGMSWELGTLAHISDGGAYRETLRYGQTVTDRNWDYQLRYLRRIIATSDAERVKSFYQHIFDVTNANGLIVGNTEVGTPGDPETDTHAAGIARINAELVEPGYARWALPSEILAEWDATR